MISRSESEIERRQARMNPFISYQDRDTDQKTMRATSERFETVSKNAQKPNQSFMGVNFSESGPPDFRDNDASHDMIIGSRNTTTL